ncbi:MAG: hypothetical protein C5S49_03585 [Candidatus Methanogaster sp.]|nr:MAG: hypothetical protein C5S49_03585 [ANME-2 cluster archaeon]
MPTSSIIRILETEPNKRGDLFGRRMGDLFLALGYDRLVRLNIHKSGREIDIEVDHRTEQRRAIAECKATKAKTGGDEINKFVGSLDVEKRKNPNIQMVGYFISLSGFKETAIEQENDAGGDRVILLDGDQVIEELVEGIITPIEKAMERAGRCASGQPVELLPELSCELLAHGMGWIWAIYFTQNKQRTHFALIHSDGESIATALAETIIESDRSVGGNIHSLNYLPPVADVSISDSKIEEVKTKYLGYLDSEYGEITLEGLPADQEVGSRRLKLENIFVPLYLERISEYQRDPSLSPEVDSHKTDQVERQPVGDVLSEYSRLAILAAPGGGKTTLLKRLAIAYAFPDRSGLVDDNLPDKSWLPLFISCRQLGDLVNSPISDILGAIPMRAEMGDLTEAFSLLVSRALRGGEALLLVDGLDEISDEGARVSFVTQLRTFLATYPNVNIVVTSREAGFRIVGGALSTHCKHYQVADFDDDDIMRLTLAWHKEVVGDSAEVRLDAEKLAKIICSSDRVRQLAKNPLLLTTLLLVNRWVGQIPTRRSVLYGKAIEMLLMTWNVEGQDPIDQEEAIPQLAFVAFTMMNDGVQTISYKRLQEILLLAREQMPEVLGYARLSVSEFIQRVEFRSSLLILSGHEIEQGTLYPMYEFRHLTFQEYLAAKAVVKGYYSDQKDDDTLLTVLKPHLADEHWKEVIPIAAVLAGRKVQPLIGHLIELCKKSPSFSHNYSEAFPAILLSQCILDEIQIAPDLLEEGLEWIARRTSGPSGVIRHLCRGKYGEILLNVVKDAYIRSDTDLAGLGSALAVITLEQINWTESQDLTPQIADKLTLLMDGETIIQRSAGALAIMEIAFYYKIRFEKIPEPTADIQKHLKALGAQLVPILYSDEPHLHFAACWAFAWLGRTGAWSPVHKPDVLSRLLKIWRESQSPDVQYVASWAISDLPLIDRKSKPLLESDPDMIGFIKKQFSLDEGDYRVYAKKGASLVMGFYWKAPWTDEELAQLVASIYGERFGDRSTLDSLLKALGEPGKAQLEALKQKQDEREMAAIDDV